jgi:capsid protein
MVAWHHHHYHRQLKQRTMAAEINIAEQQYLKSIGGVTSPLTQPAERDSAIEILQKLDAKIEAFTGAGYGGWNRVFYRPFDGEKSLGGIGPINKYWLDHDALRLRSWQLMLESEIVQTGIQRYVMWLIGSGLRLRAEPDKETLAKYGIILDSQKFAKEVEALWKLYSFSEISDNAGMETLHAKFFEAEINAIAGGDCLFIVNIDDNGLPVAEIKDGVHVRTPMFAPSFNGIDVYNPETKNRIRNGIEIDDKGQHVAFFVRKGSNYATGVADWMNYERVPARDPKTGIIRAFMYYGLRYRLDDIRGIPLIAVCMETTKQLELYKEATVQGAVERAKIALVVEHELNGSGTNPFDSVLMKAAGGVNSDIPQDSNGNSFQNHVAGTTGKQAINLPTGAQIKSIEGKQEIHFGEFYDTNLSIIFAALGIPKEVALMLFGSNYSASRASIKDWEHTLIVKRIKNVSPAYRHIYNIFLATQIMQGAVSAPGYLQALLGAYTPAVKNIWVKLAYQKAMWKGDNPPNIDEYKEVMAARLKLGEGSKHLPGITMEQFVESINEHGDWRHIAQQYQDEMQYGDDIGIEKVEEKGMTIENFDADDEDEPSKPERGKKSAQKTKPIKAVYYFKEG